MSRAREREVEHYKFNGLTTKQFAAATGQSDQQVRDLIAAQWFGWDGEKPECLNVASVGAKIPRYKILPSAVDRFRNERAVGKPKKDKAA